MSHNRSVGLAVACALGLAGCPGASSDLSVSGGDAVRMEEGGGSLDTPDPEQRDLARLAVATLAADLGVPEEQISVDSIRAVDWSDSSLGCPQPGQAYLQVITPGHRVTLRVDGAIHFVHEARGRAFVCRQRKAVAGLTPELELEWGEQALAARRDLAGRLAVPEEAVRLGAARASRGDDSSLGCPVEGEVYRAGPIEGYVLTLEHAGRRYTYHTDLARTIPCPPITAD